MLALRPYQTDACVATWHFLSVHPTLAPVIVLPTGAGKSLVIADLCRQALEWEGRIIILAHRKELLEQNSAEIQTLLPQVPVGIYSAGMKSRDVDYAIVCAGIQSCYAKAHLFGMRNLVLVDEAHLCPPSGDGMYRQFLMELSSLCPKVRLVGLTATPYRLDCGPLCSPGNLFQKVCYSAPLRKLIEDGYLSLLTNKTSETKFKLEGVTVRGGEFVPGQMEAAFDSDATEVRAACQEVVESTRDRKSVLVFAAGVRHAENVARLLRDISGEDVGCIVGETESLERSATLAAFKYGSLRFCVNCMVLTTGFNHPGIDAIAVLRATLSPGLFAQMVGRGLRKAPGKTECLILDFGFNIERHGPLDDPKYGCKEKNPTGIVGEAPSKLCPGCERIVPLGQIVCMNCGFEFPREQNRHGSKADGSNDILVEPTTWEVVGATASVHVKKGATEDTPLTMRVIYEVCFPGVSGNLSSQKVSEWVCFDHEGFARAKAEKWWRQCSGHPVPDTVQEAVDLFNRGACGIPSEITTIPEGHFTRITDRKVEKKTNELTVPEFDEWAVPAETPEYSDDEVPF